jgi:CBS domain containing-hemolysin-like protein
MPRRHNLENNPTEQSASTIFQSILRLWPFKNREKSSLKLNPGQDTNESLKEKTEILNNAYNFDKKTLEDVMIPRSDICAVKSNVTLDELNNTIIKNSHTRTLVYEDNLDNIIGFVHIKDLFRVIANGQKFELKKIIRQPIIAPQSMTLIDVLSEMRKKRIHIVLVVDEYGGIDGMVTIEDVIEEIFGEIDDEHNNNAHASYKIIDNNTIISSARVEVDELERVLGVSLSSEDDEFDTIGGLVLAKVGSVPASGTVIDISDAVKIEVVEASSRILKQVKIILKV